MRHQNPPDSVIRDVLSRAMTIAVVGCSPDPRRDSHRIARFLADRGHRVLPVNPTCPRILDRVCHPDLRSISEPVDMVDVFRRSEHLRSLVEDAIAIGARILWTQLGVVDDVAANRATDAGMLVVMDRCPAIEYPKLFGRD